MGGDGDILLLFEDTFNLLVVNIFELSVIFFHEEFNRSVIPNRQISMEFVILRKHGYLFRVFGGMILSF